MRQEARTPPWKRTSVLQNARRGGILGLWIFFAVRSLQKFRFPVISGSRTPTMTEDCALTLCSPVSLFGQSLRLSAPARLLFRNQHRSLQIHRIPRPNPEISACVPAPVQNDSFLLFKSRLNIRPRNRSVLATECSVRSPVLRMQIQ